MAETSVGSVALGVKPDTSKFGGELKQSLSRKLSGVGESLGSSLGSTLMKGLGVVGIAASIGGAIKTGFSELMDASAGTAQLAAGIKSTGNAAGVTVEGLNNLASSIQAYSGQTDDSIVASEKLLLTFTNIKNSAGAGNDIFNQATKATADLAAKMGGDASGAAIQLGKALNDPVKGIAALTRVGVSFDDQQKAQIKSLVASGDTMKAQKIILAELNKEFGGSAAAYGNSLPGMIDRSKRAFEDLTQTLAQTLLPIVTPVLEGLLKGFQKVQPFIQQFSDNVGRWMKQLAPTFKELAPQVLNAVTAFSPLHNLFEVLKPVLPQLIQLVVSLAKNLGGALSSALQQIMPPLLQVGGMLINQLTGIIKMLMPTILKLADILGKTLGEIIRQLAPVVVMLVKAIGSLLGPLMPVISAVLRLVLDALKPLLAVILPLIRIALPILVGLLKFLIPIVTAVANVFENVLVGAIQIAVDIIRGIVNTTIGFINTVIDGINSISGIAKSVTGGKVDFHINHIPAMANGGVVPATPGGRLIRVAEAGQAEAIIPLDKMAGLTSHNSNRPIYADGVGLIGWMRETARGESKLVFNTELNKALKGSR